MPVYHVQEKPEPAGAGRLLSITVGGQAQRGAQTYSSLDALVAGLRRVLTPGFRGTVQIASASSRNPIPAPPQAGPMPTPYPNMPAQRHGSQTSSPDTRAVSEALQAAQLIPGTSQPVGNHFATGRRTHGVRSQGDEAGTMGGVASPQLQNTGMPQANHASPNAPPGQQLAPAQVNVILLA